MLADLRFAVRQLRKSPGFALTAVLTLALGIGATTAIFTLFDQVLLRMLPVDHPKQLVRFLWRGSFSGSITAFGGDSGSYYSYPEYRDLRSRSKVFSGMLASVKTNVGIVWQNQAADEDAEVVSGNYFQVLGLHPAAGRLFTASDETSKDANPVVALSYDYWRARFGASPQVVGQTLRVNGHPFTIVGVAPENFLTAIGGYRPRVFVPLTMVDTAMPFMASRHPLDEYKTLWLTLVARLKPGVTPQQAQASLVPLWHAERAQELTLYKSVTPRFREGFLDRARLFVLDDSTGFSPGRMDLKMPLTILLSMAGLLLAMCALNVATLLLLRATARVREMSMRYALGAKPRRIVRQLLVEGGMLGLAGAAAGLALAPTLTRALLHLISSAEPDSQPWSASLDGRALGFALGVSLLVALLFSIAPVLHFLRPDLAGALRQSTGTASIGSQRFRKAAVGVQIALSVMLLGGAGLFVRTLGHLRDQPVGFDTTHLATFSLDPGSSGYTADRTPQILTSAIQALERVSGVTQAAATTDPELAGDTNISGFVIQGHRKIEGEDLDFEAPSITPGFFSALQQPLLAGREFTPADRRGAPKVAVVNTAFAKRFYGSASNALGRMVGMDDTPDTTIVGVVGDIHHADLRTPLGPAVYTPYLQQEHPSGVQMYIRTRPDPETALPAIRRAMHDFDPSLVVGDLRTMEAQVDISASDERMLAILASAFAALAALLSAVGLYGVLAYSTESRTREIGVRLALGSPRSSLVGLIVREMAWIALGATVAAVPATVALAHLFRSELYGVSSWDPVSLAAALLLTAVMVAAAAALPARRATAVNPITALRTD